MMRKTEKSEKSIPQELTMQFTSGCAVFHRVLWPSAGVNERYDNMNKLYLFFSVVGHWNCLSLWHLKEICMATNLCDDSHSGGYCGCAGMLRSIRSKLCWMGFRVQRSTSDHNLFIYLFLLFVTWSYNIYLAPLTESSMKKKKTNRRKLLC